MAHYCLYCLDADRRSHGPELVYDAEVVTDDTDEEAIARARRHAQGRNFSTWELWALNRRVVTWIRI